MESTNVARRDDPEGRTGTDTPATNVDIQPAVFGDEVIVPSQFFSHVNRLTVILDGRATFAVCRAPRRG
jgi:hypothetical protein